MLKTRLRQVFDDPKRLPTAVLRRLSPTHRRFGSTVVRRPDGSVTFREAGFVSARSPAELLARHNFETAVIRDHFRARHFDRSLEIGCGYGRLTPTFADFSDEHFPVDINPEALELAAMTYPDYHFSEASALELPFPDQHFGLISTWTVIQHIPPSQIERACNEIVRVLAVGGLLLICEETKFADAPLSDNAHTWHRRVDTYKDLFGDLQFRDASAIASIERLPGVHSPGTVMVWEKA